MKKIIVVISAWVLVFGACTGTKKVTYADGGLTKITDKGYITVVGLATDQLNRTAIKDENGVYYVMKGVERWSSDVENKMVTARGKLLIVDRTELMKSSKFMQGGPAITYFLTDAKWKIID
jgi:hypothetical protein